MTSHQGAPALAVFCDFDGTFSVQDVGSTLVRMHAADRQPEAWARYERGELTAWDYNLEVLDRLPLPERELDAFLHTVDLDPGARELLAWCERRGIPFRILSDGFDYNLDRLQEIHGVQFDYDANRLRYEDGQWRISVGFPDPRCGCGTGTCKGSRIRAYRRERPEARVIHVGNGKVSDLCGAIAADTVFAKESLALALEARGVAFRSFVTLHDVTAGLEEMLQ